MSTIISNVAPFGSLTNQMVRDLYNLNLMVTRLNNAVASAASGYAGTAGVEYEGTTNNFGVVPVVPPGKAGSDFAYAVGVLSNNWATFWTAAQSSIESMDNGVI